VLFPLSGRPLFPPPPPPRSPRIRYDTSLKRPTRRRFFSFPPILLIEN